MKQDDVLREIDRISRKMSLNNSYGPITLPASFYATFSTEYPKTTAALGRLMPKYKFSRAKWYVADFDWIRQGEVLEWCRQQFGPHPKFPDAWSRWHNRYQEKIYFRDEKDYQWFVLRWGV